MKKITFSLFVLAAIVSLFFYFPKNWWEDLLVMPFRNFEYNVDFQINVGDTALQVAKRLEEKGIVVSYKRLIHYMTKYGVDRKLRPGSYTFEPGPSWKVAKQFMVVQPKVAKVTIIPGTALDDYWKLDSPSKVNMDISDFPKGLRPLLPSEDLFKSAFLLPETYYLSKMDAHLLIEVASSAWWKSFKDHIPLEQSKLTKLAIVASLVEMESLLDNERPKIAGVIYNRLAKNMPLQIDATIVFAWAQKGRQLKRVTYKDLKIESDYNTYLNRGLPPGPICIPSEESWIAAIAPESHSFLYYVANGDGSHIFSKNYKEHKRAIRKIRNK